MDIAIIDYGIGNLRSAEKAFQAVGLDAHLTRDAAALKTARKIVLPGVGAFGQCMAGLRAHGFVAPLLAEVAAGKPLLGICVGLQMLFERSEENPEEKGLGLLEGEVVRFKGPAFEGASALKVPQIGWNGLQFPAQRHGLFNDLKPDDYVYFVHSFHARPARNEDILASAEYGALFCASAGRANVMGVQFHPEKSQRVGLKIIENFGKL